MSELVRCETCGRTKVPIGRDPGAAAANDYCDHDCSGYMEPPEPGGDWPAEEVFRYEGPVVVRPLGRGLMPVDGPLSLLDVELVAAFAEHEGEELRVRIVAEILP